MWGNAGVSDRVMGKLIGQSKVKRYWPGKAPEWAAKGDDDDILEKECVLIIKEGDDDGTLHRVAKNKVDNNGGDEVSQCQIQLGQENHHEEEAKKEEEDLESNWEDNRSEIREKNIQRLHQEEEAAAAEDESVFDLKEEEEEERPGGVKLIMKPMFIPPKSSDRSIIEKRKRLEAEQEESKKRRRRIEEERKKETKQIVVDLISKDTIDEIHKNTVESEEVANINDEIINEAEEYKAHLSRNIARSNRNRENREAALKQKEEEKRMEWDWPKKQKNKKLKFMQRYFHKGAFFQTQVDGTFGSAALTDDGFYTRRDYSAPTGDDKMDKTILPEVMQVKNFGRRGRTKWTHLVDADTTDWSLWI